jgi:hypothetical protein
MAEILASSWARGNRNAQNAVLMNRGGRTAKMASMDGKNNLEFQPQHTIQEGKWIGRKR